MRKAFTLAEVLITLGIIGVVSAMTIPTLIHKYKNDEYVAGMKKAYSTLSQAVLSAKEQAGLENLGSTLPVRITEQMECTNINWADGVSYSLGVADILPNEPGISGGGPLCLLSNGMFFEIGKDNYPSVLWGSAVVDINAGKSPNLYGRDRWLFYITEDGRVIPAGAEIRNSDTGELVTYSDLGINSDNIRSDRCAANVNSGTGYGCSGYLLKNNWVMDY